MAAIVPAKLSSKPIDACFPETTVGDSKDNTAYLITERYPENFNVQIVSTQDKVFCNKALKRLFGYQNLKT